jgi:D-alanine-D-alanine ligase
MSADGRPRVGILFGGPSAEHEVSCSSALAAVRALPRERYEPVVIVIARDGGFALVPDELIDRLRRPPAGARAIDDRLEVVGKRVELRPAGLQPRAVVTAAHDPADVLTHLDVVWPLLHGPYGEDGTIQGLLELANVPYVGAGVLASAVGMDKAIMKVLFTARGLPICAYCAVLRHDWERYSQETLASLEQTLGYPMFVKPANLGSSVGISKAKDRSGLSDAIALAGSFDRKIVIEAAVPNAREIECAVLGNDEPEASVAGEVIPSHEFYDYEAKYIDQGSRVIIPADLPADTAGEIRRVSIEAFKAIDGAGMARVDFLLSRDNGRLYVNEVNTIPGFTTISMFAKLWQASGLTYSALLDRLVQLALARHADKQQLRTSMT